MALAVVPVASVGADPLPLGDSDSERARVRELKQQADNARQAAEKKFQADQSACYDKFLVSACLDDARKARSAALVAARRPDSEAREIERRLRQREADEREARRAADAPRRAAEAAEQAARNKAEQEEAMQRVARRQAERAAPSSTPEVASPAGGR